MRRQSGFTLLEVVVAFALLAAVLATMFQIFSAGLNRAADLDDYTRALAIAQSRLAAAGVEADLREGVQSGQSEDRRFTWSQSVRRDPQTQEASAAQQAAMLVLYRVDVRVSWDSTPGKVRDLALSSLALGPRP